jgi:hypothetical protein
MSFALPRSLEFLREKIHLRVRTNTISAIQRIRNCLVRVRVCGARERGWGFNTGSCLHRNTSCQSSSVASGSGTYIHSERL